MIAPSPPRRSVPTGDNASGSLVRAARVLQAIASAPKGRTLREVTSQTGMSHPTAHRVCAMLIELGWLERDQNKRFFLGKELSILGLAALRRHPLEAIARPLLEALNAATGQTVYLLARSHDEAVCLSRIEGRSVVRTFLLDVGSRWPLGWGAGGMAILATLPDTEAAEIIARNRERFAALDGFDQNQFEKRLEFARANKYARHDGLIIPGVSGISAAIVDNSGSPVAAVSTAFVSDWLEDAEKQRCVALVKETAGRLSALLSKSGAAA